MKYVAYFMKDMHNAPMNTVFLKRRMSEKGMDVVMLARRCMVAPRYMGQVLKGLTPSKRLIMSIAEELECKPSKIAPGVFLPNEKASAEGKRASVS